jgi:hypothetical protein
MAQRARKREEQQKHRFRRRLGRKSGPVPISSHPEIEEEIEQLGGGIDESRVKLESPPPAVKPIMSVDGKDVDGDSFQNDKAA